MLNYAKLALDGFKSSVYTFVAIIISCYEFVLFF